MARQKQALENPLILQKIYNYCSYQERSIREVENKLKSLTLQKKLIPEMIKRLQKEGYLNEGRFAKAYAAGKFRQNKWGRQKIEFELKIRGIPELMILEGLSVIDEEEYRKVLKNLIVRKYNEIKSGENENIWEKIINFAYGKGYESELILSILKELKI
jgi:regulatory protein